MMRRLIGSRGVYRHWQRSDGLATLEAESPQLESILEMSEQRAIPDGSVWTFNVAPDSRYGIGCDYTFDTFGLLTLRPGFDQWRMVVVNQSVE